MNKTLRKFFALGTMLLFAGTGFRAQASHSQGSELTYSCVAPNTYIVSLKIYRDCTGIAAPTTATLNIKSVGCNPGRGQAMTKVGTNRIGNDYCAQIAPTCTTTGQPNYEEVTFTTTLSFGTAEQQCPEWILSWQECCRPNSANIVNAQSYNLYAEAYLRISHNGGNIMNNSPQFNSLVVPFVGAYKPIVLSSFAVDPDGDSLAYSLQSALTSPGMQVVMAPYPGIILLNSDSTKSMVAPPGNYSPTFPMPSYFVDWTQPAPYSAVQNFVLDPANGSLSFTPSLYHANTTSVQGMNKYVVVVQVDEFRKINGQVVKVGVVRRDMFVTVVDCGLNNNPVVAAPVANGQPITPSTIIELRPGTPLTFTFNTHDTNVSDVLELDSDAATILPGAVFTKTTGSRPSGTVTWTPGSADVRSQIYYFHITVQDDACPIKGQHIQTFGVRVSNTGGVTGISKSLNAQPTFTAYPNPFAATVTFKVKQTQPQQEILIYNVLGQQVDQLQLKGQLNTEQEVRWTNAAKFPAGQYLVRFSGSAGQSIRINKLQ